MIDRIETISVCPLVATLALRMQERLEENVRRGGWNIRDASDLFRRCLKNLGSLHAMVFGPGHWYPCHRLRDAADVAILAAMLVVGEDGVPYP